jgi:hypothetical protein
MASYATAGAVVPIFAIATIFSSGTFGFRAGHASNPDGILMLFVAAAVGYATAELFPMLALSDGGTSFLKAATAIGLIYAGYVTVASTMFAWADRGKEYLVDDRVGQIRLETKVNQASSRSWQPRSTEPGRVTHLDQPPAVNFGGTRPDPHRHRGR